MPNRHSLGHRDKNESQITAVLDSFYVRYLKAREGHGFDLLILVQPVQLWEIKNPEAKPSDRELTDTEQAIKDHCDKEGIPYHIIEDPQQAADILSNHFRKPCMLGADET